MNLKFGCEEIIARQQRSGPVKDEGESDLSARHLLRGLCCAAADDRFGPAPEWRSIGTDPLALVERTTLAAYVDVLSEAQWAARFSADHRYWSPEWSKDSAGNALDADFLTQLQASLGSAVEEAPALACYAEPYIDPTWGSVFDSRDAKIWIRLRMTDLQLKEWNAFGLKFIGAPPPAWSVTLNRVMFAENDIES